MTNKNFFIGVTIIFLLIGYCFLLARLSTRGDWEVAICLLVLLILILNLYIQIGTLKTFTVRMLIEIKLNAEKAVKNLEDIQQEKNGEKPKVDETNMRH
jgi:protein-S-isoprenylcysteine O-methyltransferase Ste14